VRKSNSDNIVIYFSAIVLLLITVAAKADDAASDPPKKDPFAFADFSWLNGNSRQKTPVFDSKAFTGELLVDTNYVYDLNHPKDHTLVGSSELGRTDEVQLQSSASAAIFTTTMFVAAC